MLLMASHLASQRKKLFFASLCLFLSTVSCIWCLYTYWEESRYLVNNGHLTHSGCLYMLTFFNNF